MAGAKSQDAASPPGIQPPDHESAKAAKPKRKKPKKLKKGKGGESAVLAHADDGAAQPPPARPKGNRAEAELIRQRLGIKAEDVKSTQTRVGFQFAFSVEEPCPGTEAGNHDDADVQTNIDTRAASPPKPPEPDPAKSKHGKADSKPIKEPPARHVKAKPSMQPDESGFIPRRAFIGGMPFWYTEDEIRQCWAECGEISDLTMLTFPDTGNFRGIVFITFATEEGFDAALKFNGDELDGKHLVVQRCKAPVPAPGAAAREGRMGQQQRGGHREGGPDGHQKGGGKASEDGTSGDVGHKRRRSEGAAGRNDAHGAASPGGHAQGDQKGVIRHNCGSRLNALHSHDL